MKASQLTKYLIAVNGPNNFQQKPNADISHEKILIFFLEKQKVLSGGAAYNDPTISPVIRYSTCVFY